MNAPVDLVPVPCRQLHTFWDILKFWGGLAGISVLGLGCVYSFFRNELGIQEKGLGILQQSEQQVLAVMAGVADSRSRIQELKNIESYLDSLLPSDELLQTLGALSVATHQTTTSSPPTLRRLSIDITKATLATEAPEANAEMPTCLTFDVVASHELPIHSALDVLRSHPRFYEVRIRSTGQNDSRNEKRFQVESSLFVTKETPK